jgi:hypothetical protein
METTGSRPTADLKVIAMPSTMKFFRALISVAAVLALVGCGAATATPNASTSSPIPVDAADAQRAALTLFVVLEPGKWWGPCSTANNYAACPLSTTVKTRIAELNSTNYFYTGPGGQCGGDFISNSTNGLFKAPVVLSAVTESNGSVTVVIQRVTALPNLTATMTMENGKWLATDLASGTGSSASIFSAKPNC